AVRAVYPSLTDLPVLVPVMAGLAVGAAAGLANGALIAYTSIPPFIATLGVMVSARGIAKWYTHGQPVSMLTDAYADIGAGAVPVMIFLGTALIFHIALRYTRYGKFTYAIGAASRSGGIGRITGTVVGTLILGVVTSGFTFLRIDAYYQEIVKGAIIVAAVIADQYRHRAGGRRA